METDGEVKNVKLVELKQQLDTLKKQFHQAQKEEMHRLYSWQLSEHFGTRSVPSVVHEPSTSSASTLVNNAVQQNHKKGFYIYFLNYISCREHIFILI